MNRHLGPRCAAALLLALTTLTTACSGSTAGISPAADALPQTGRSAPAASKVSGAVRGVPLVPAQGALLGHFYGSGTMAATDARIGRKPAVHLTYYDWSDDWTGSSSTTRADLADGRVPLVNWEPDNIDFDDIVSGALDSTIRKRADGAKALGKKFFLDFAAEMNEEEGWGGHRPAKYIAAYRHIHDIFVARGATNVVWTWCPNVTDSAGDPSTMAYYPGDGYVDWTGIDGYNWGTSDPDFTWQSFEDTFSAAYAKLAATGKPVIIAETASDEVGGSKAAWIAGIVPALKTKFPLIKAVVWFDIDKERHWQIDSSPSSLASYRRMAKDPYLNP
ncbi:glycoside hydrolase family 26 protein [Streptomyces sp. R39]|uniref:Glycoside hydrolase family 26 protein n=1 Tax=Streptomyces sp. R39 TaxID=3238631 RepID=A0AB39QTA0_9ACTN